MSWVVTVHVGWRPPSSRNNTSELVHAENLYKCRLRWINVDDIKFERNSFSNKIDVYILKWNEIFLFYFNTKWDCCFLYFYHFGKNETAYHLFAIMFYQVYIHLQVDTIFINAIFLFYVVWWKIKITVYYGIWTRIFNLYNGGPIWGSLDLILHLLEIGMDVHYFNSCELF